MFRRISICFLALIWLAACSGEVYLRDGVTDGDTFYLAQRALTDDNPVLQSWVAYSLTKSTCQLEIGGDNPARASSFDCELTARRVLAEAWQKRQAEDSELADAYLDDLSAIAAAGFLDEYITRHFRRKSWDVPDNLELRAYRKWRRKNLSAHKIETHIVGSWNYAHKVRSF